MKSTSLSTNNNLFPNKIIVISIVLIALFSAIYIFRHKSRVRLVDTMIRTESIRNLGYICTATYFGEVLCSDRELQNFKGSGIVYLARGWVKAGIRLDSLTRNDFIYDEQNNSLTIINLKPEILWADINPWYIYEEHIKGFEIVANEFRYMNPKAMSELKKLCKQKLIADALSKNLLAESHANAERNLLNFAKILGLNSLENVIIKVDEDSLSNSILTFAAN